MPTKIRYLSPQQVFNRVSSHLLRQNAKSESSCTSECRYRGEGGLKCAVGAVIPDKFFDDRIEGIAVDSARDVPTSLIARILIKSKINVKNNDVMALLGDLQSCHDDYAVDEWKLALKNIAREYDLKFSAPKNKAS